jgi:hypothetical protein
MASRKAVPVSPAQTPATPVASPEPILTIEDIAVPLKFDNTREVYESTRKRNKRSIPAIRAGKVLRSDGSDVERWLDPRRLVARSGFEPKTSGL